MNKEAFKRREARITHAFSDNMRFTERTGGAELVVHKVRFRNVFDAKMARLTGNESSVNFECTMYTKPLPDEIIEIEHETDVWTQYRVTPSSIEKKQMSNVWIVGLTKEEV